MENKENDSSNEQTEDAGQQKTEAKTYSEEQFKGLLADKQVEVDVAGGLHIGLAFFLDQWV